MGRGGRDPSIPRSGISGWIALQGDSELVEALEEEDAQGGQQQDDGKDHEELDGLGQLVNTRDQFALLVGHGIAGAIEKDLIIFTNFEGAAIGEKSDEN